MRHVSDLAHLCGKVVRVDRRRGVAKMRKLCRAAAVIAGEIGVANRSRNGVLDDVVACSLTPGGTSAHLSFVRDIPKLQLARERG
jgi:hypothetical protein